MTGSAAVPVPLERNQDATLYVGGLDEKVSESLLWELMVQAGPVLNVHVPRDRVTNAHQGYAFVEMMNEEDAEYACKILNMVKLFGKPLRLSKASARSQQLDVGANLFVGNLDVDVDEKLLYDTFSAFGMLLQTPKIVRDPSSGNPRGFAFLSFATFEASDAAIEAMNGQFLCNRPITVSYAFKKDGRGERHGSAAERLLASQNPIVKSLDRPNTMFADAPPPMLLPLPVPGSAPTPIPPVGVPGFIPGAVPGVMPGMVPGMGPGGMGMPMGMGMPGMFPPPPPPPTSMTPMHQMSMPFPGVPFVPASFAPPSQPVGVVPPQRPPGFIPPPPPPPSSSTPRPPPMPPGVFPPNMLPPLRPGFVPPPPPPPPPQSSSAPPISGVPPPPPPPPPPPQ